MEWIKAIILGIVEGVTEFLPISSTGHLIVAAELLQFRAQLRVTFEIFIQLGAVIAVILFYQADLRRQFLSVRSDPGVMRLWRNLVVAAVPAAFLGFLLKDWITRVLFTPTFVAIALIVGGIIMLIVERRFGHDNGNASDPHRMDTLQSMTLKQAAVIGIAQILALFPGASRSAASIIGGLLAGLNRRSATQFSFFLAIPTLGGATVYELLSNFDTFSSADIGLLLVGTLVSAIVAWYSMGWLLRFVAHHKFTAFAYYRIVAGAIILLLSTAKYLT